MFEDDYRLYRLKHNLIDMKRTQYYLKDTYKPQLHFLALDHPKLNSMSGMENLPTGYPMRNGKNVLITPTLTQSPNALKTMKRAAKA